MADATTPDRITARPALLALHDRERPAASLPVSLTSFVGREREIAAVRDLLRSDGVRLVTLTGPGGVGKTRLAVQVAADLTDDFAGDVAFVPLAPIADPDLVAPAIAQALGVRVVGDQPVIEHLIAALRERRSLLVLDNFEQILAAAPLVVDLLTACPRLTLLVTSRATLNVSGEQAVPVPPLTLPAPADDLTAAAATEAESVRLFVARARAAKPDFALTDAGAVTVVDVCRRLDGLPLAIELAAARVNVLSPAALLDRLDRRLSLLTGGPRDAPPRLRSMEDAIAWSYDLLPSEEQALFRRLAVFVGGFTLEAVEWVLGVGCRVLGDDDSPTPNTQHPTPAVLDLVASLVSKSLLRTEEGPESGADGEPRFGMLETIREFGLDRLASSGEESEIRDRHAAFFLALAEGGEVAFVPDGARVLARLEADHANLRVALAWLEEAGDAERMLRLAGALTRFWQHRGHLGEGRAWLERALGRRAEARASAVARGVIGLARMFHFQGHERQGLALGEEGLALARAADDPFEVFWGLTLCGLVTLRLGDLTRAAAFQAEALALLPSLGDATWVRLAESTVLGNLGNIAVGRGDVAGAEVHFIEALARQRSLGFHPGTSHVAASHPLAGLGDVARARRDLAAALARYQDACRLAHRFRDTRATAYALGGVAGTLAVAGDWEHAARLFGAAEALHERAGLPFDLETMDRQRALGLPEPWLRAGESFGSGQTLRDALTRRRTVTPAAIPEADRAARRWAEGRALPIEEAIAEALAAQLPADTAPPLLPEHSAGLTPRQLEVVRLVAAGRSNREIADALSISVPTVKRHLSTVLGTLGVPSRSALNTYAHTHDLV